MGEDNLQLNETMEHFHWGHFGAIALCVVFLVGVTFLKNGFHLAPISEINPGSTMTYAQAKAQVEQENPDLVAMANGGADTSNIASSDNPTTEQIAMIDPSQSGAVLGASTGTGDDVTSQIEAELTPEGIQQIKINSLGYTNADVVSQYADKVSSIENNYNALSLIGNFSSTDSGALLKNEQITPLIISELTGAPVPSDLEEYNRLKILYYTVLQSMAEMKLGKVADDQFPTLSNMLFAIMDKLNTDRGAIKDKYQIIIQ